MAFHVVVVGAGPAGMEAAIEAFGRGAEVTLIDEGARPGGQIFRQSATGTESKVGLPRELERKTDLLVRFEAVRTRIDYRAGQTAYALFPGPELHVSADAATSVLKPDVVVLATGVCERAVPFPGWTLPGVVFAGGAQAMLKAQGVCIGDRVVLVGAGPLPIAVAAQLVQAGVHVAAVALLHPLRTLISHPYSLWAGRRVVYEGWQYLRTLRRAGVEVMSRCVPLRAGGSDHVESIQLAQHDGTGSPVPGTETRVACDALALNYGFTANSELANMAGAAFEYLPARGGWVPVTDGLCRTTLPGVVAAGDVAGLRGAWVAQAEGRIAGAVAACYRDDKALEGLQHALCGSFRERRRHEIFQRAVQQTLRLPPGVWGWADAETVVCRCECVTFGRIRSAIDAGHTTLNGIKKNTRAGMGWCGGRVCLQNIAACLKSGKPPVDLAPMTPRPLARPVIMAAIAEQGTA